MVGEKPKRSRAWAWKVAIAIAAVVAYLILLIHLMPGSERARESARRASCKNNLKQIGLALHIYATDHEGEFPPGETAVEVFGKLIEEGLLDETWGFWKIPVFVCPGAKEDVKAWKSTRTLTEETCSYDYVSGLSIASPPEFALAFDRSVTNHAFTASPGEGVYRGRLVLHVDGHTSWSAEEGLQEWMKWQGEMMERVERGGGYVRFDKWRGARAEE